MIKPYYQDELLTTVRVKPLSARDFSFKEISVFAACKLNHEWHSRLPEIDWSNVTRNRYYICFGAFYQNEIFAVAIWSSPVNQYFDILKTLELRRMAISPDAPKFTASRMISKMVKEIKLRFPLVDKLISYQDTQVHKGTIYKASNWIAAKETEYKPWNKSRKRSESQSDSNKIRWEFNIKTQTVMNFEPVKEKPKQGVLMS
jgi:hypothetical protein